MSKIERGLTVRLAEFKSHPMNYNAHPQKQIKALRESLRIFEQVRDVVVWREFIIAGHGVVEAATAEGWTDISATRLPDDWDEERVLAYLAVDNETARLSESDDAQLAALLQGVSDEELRVLAAGGEDRLRSLIEADAPMVDAEPQMDRAEELRIKWGVKQGDIWQMGEHVVICADCREPETWRRLLAAAEMERPDLLLTDPPYGIKRDEGFGGFGGFGPPIARRQYSDSWDDDRPVKSTFDYIVQLAEHAIIFGGNFFADILPRSTHWIVWDKLQTMPTFGDCELLWTNFERKSVKKITFEYNGLIGKEAKRYHPTQKPLGLFMQIVAEYSKDGACIVDSFLGSGTTIVACEKTGRVGYGMEIEPKYVAVTLERLSEMGLEPRLVE